MTYELPASESSFAWILSLLGLTALGAVLFLVIRSVSQSTSTRCWEISESK